MKRLLGILHLFADCRVWPNALRIALVVGTGLNLINQGEYLLAGQPLMAGHLLLNYLVPYCVSAYSAALAILDEERSCAATRPTPPERSPE